MSVSSSFVTFKIQYSLTPIILGPGGLADAQGGAIPIITLTDNVGLGGNTDTGDVLAQGVQSISGGPAVSPELDGYFASYYPLPGSTLIENQVAMYPFANQQIAANALVTQPLKISMMMFCPAGTTNVTYAQKRSKMSSLQASLAQHNALGGLYSIMTPSYVYTNCIMVSMRDVSGEQTMQKQFMYQIDFIQPLVTTAAAQQALNGLTQKLTNGSAPAGTATASQGLPVTNPGSALGQLTPSPT